MNEALDGDYQTYKSRNGAYVREHFFGVKPELRAMVADMSDDEIWALNRGGLDQRKVYAAYHAAVEHHGQPTVILAKTIKGYGMGVAGEGQNITHQQKKMNETALLAFRDRFELDADRRAGPRPLVLQAAGPFAGDGVHPRAPGGAGRLAAAAADEGGAAARAGAERVPGAARRLGRPRELDHDGVRAGPVDDPARQAARPARRADRPRRVAHVRHGGHVPPAGHLQPGRPAVHARGPRAADVLPRGQARPGAPGGHQRGRRDVVVDRRRERRTPTTACRRSRSTSTTRCSASSGSATSPGRPATAARAGSCSAARRGGRRSTARASSTRTATRTPAPRTIPNCVVLRPGVRLRGGGDHPRGPAADARRAGGRLLLPHADERELPAPAHAGGRGRGDPARDLQAARRRRGREAAAAGLWVDPARGASRAPTCCATTSASSRTSSA